MIDFIKIEIPFYQRTNLLNNQKLDFKADYSLTTGETFDEKMVAEWNGMKFISTSSERLFVQGSIHKYYNFIKKEYAPNQFSEQRRKKGFNGNTFNLTQLKYSINHLCDLIKIKPLEAILRGVEHGLNIDIENDSHEFLDALINHKQISFSSVKEIDQYFRQVKHQRYIIKCYDKQIQYGLENSIIRFENKQMKMFDLKSISIKTLEDLMNIKNLTELKLLLLKKWDEVVLFDYTIKKRHLNNSQKNQLKDLSNPRIWQKIKSNHTHRFKMRLKSFSENYGTNLHKEFKKKLNNQWDFQNQNCVTFNRLFKEQIV